MSAYARAQALAALLRKQHVDGDDLPDFRAEEEHAGKVEGLTAASAPDQCDEPGNKRDVDEEVEGEIEVQQVVAVPQHRQDRQQRERSRKIVTPPLEGAQEQHEQSQFQGRGEQPQGGSYSGS